MSIKKRLLWLKSKESVNVISNQYLKKILFNTIPYQNKTVQWLLYGRDVQFSPIR